MVKIANFYFIFYICKQPLFQGKSVAKALHMHSNCLDSDYQRLVRLFSLQLQALPIKITIKELFTLNHALLKTVSSDIKQHF